MSNFLFKEPIRRLSHSSSEQHAPTSVCPYFTLNNGVKIPAIGFGTCGVVASSHDPNDTNKGSYELFKEAVKIGYRHFDTAFLYGTERALGKALRECIDEGIVKREDLFVVSKVWNTAHKRESVMKSAKRSCEELGFDYVDALLIHWPGAYVEDGHPITPVDEEGKILYSDVDYTETWQGMEDVLEAGLSKSIGVSNFNHQQIDRVLAMCKHKPTINQVECHPYLCQRELFNYCESKDIFLTAYCPLGSPGKNDSKPDDPILLEDELIKQLAHKYHKTPAQIVIKFQIQRDVIVIPKSSNIDRIRSNFDVFDFQLTQSEIESLEALDKGLRYCQNVAGRSIPDHPHFPFIIDYFAYDHRLYITKYDILNVI